ncbi:cellulase family glycosylhydrolase [Mucilaginibacter sp. KACC 22063]|uniref:cellulase family glycosylhydrolase n=1 Tax=Mucilaginibacter sp. KACC 22063 TaxID=3025666 RepID=UPI0023661567|nr:cellulase family glycosylhydrolase [Mucilaginibacter sp. KACC 22063]WDF53769.1 cellulase family glycosylhydrolase [Mucilaginibacter sp. KACC 22063]
MKKAFKYGSVAAMLLLVMLPSLIYAQGYLKASGKIITDGNGKKIILRGMGLGGWMLQEGYMFKVSNLGQQHIIRQKIEEITDADYTAKFYDRWLANNTRKIDIDSMRSWGFNSIRLPMHFDLYTLPVDQEPVAEKNTWLEKGFAMTDSLLKWCKANKMYLILDLHATPGGQGNDLNISDRYPDKPSLWDSKANQDKMIALWHKLAERYANEPYIGGYDIINEPNWGFESTEDKRGTNETKNAPLRQLMVDITKSIREVDKNHIIIIEGNGFGNNYKGIFPLWDNNTVISFHKYGNFNTQQAIQNFLNISQQYNVPLWLGESGENSNTWFTEAISLVESHDIGWSWWQLKKIGINNPLEIKLTPSYQTLLDYWSGKGPKPAKTDAEAALNEFLNNIKLENNIYHKDVTDAMFRQVHTTATVPFKKVTVSSKAQINTVDYDLGRQRYAYFDKDTASYQYTPGVHTQGNRGRTYRNDGVDIKADENGYYIFSIEDGEWTQYTFNVEKSGNYNIDLDIMADNADGQASLILNGVSIQGIAIPQADKSKGWHPVTFKNVKLNKGKNVLRVMADKGGFDLRSVTFSKN